MSRYELTLAAEGSKPGSKGLGKIGNKKETSYGNGMASFVSDRSGMLSEMRGESVDHYDELKCPRDPARPCLIRNRTSKRHC